MSYSDKYLSMGNNRDGYTWYHCDCCPYGYHIDLDFVRYCESISQESERSGSIKRRKDRRRQRQSMEVLLGLTPPLLTSLEQTYKTIQEQEAIIKTQSGPKLYQNNHDEFADAVSDFERTLQRSKNKLSNNLPDVTAVSENICRAPSMSSMSSASGSSMTVLPSATDGTIVRDFDAVSIESCGLSPAALQNIREQMALSLERTKELEDQVKLIPSLQVQLSVLKEEKRKLLLRLKAEETSRLNNINANYLGAVPYYNRSRSQSFSNIDSLDSLEKKDRKTPPPPPLPRRDFGVMCSVLTRNVGVGHQCPNMKTVSTITCNGETTSDFFSDKWYTEKIKFMNSQNINHATEAKRKSSILIPKQTQTAFFNDKKDSITQTLNFAEKNKTDSQTQTVENKKYFHNVGINVIPQYSHFHCQVGVDKTDVGVSDNTIKDIICAKCLVIKNSVGVGPDNNVDAHTSPVSLASLSVPRSKSFNLGEDRLNLSTRNRTVGIQYEPSGITKGCQHEITMHSKASQNETKTSHKSVQYESNSISKTTDTKDLQAHKKHVACEAKETKLKTHEVGSNTSSHASEKNNTPCLKCVNKEKEEAQKKDDPHTPSRIPRPQIPTTPVENRKFKRQDTYTKIPAPTLENQTLSGLDLSPKNIDTTSPFGKVKHNLKLPEVSSPISSSAQNGVNSIANTTKVQIPETTLPLSETALCHPITQTHRKKAVPSKEMLAAMKVLNDSLKKGSTKNLKNQLKNATSIIQQEWFNISSMVTANPLDVEDYLDCFEEISCVLLEYIVNMIDASGNTAMHYAVSHGNFDVVSILLDSKVCDINKPNKAGYTSVMLVSLAEVRSQTDASVVRRLFQLADNNIRAKQHGQTALMLAVSHGRLDMVKMLLEAGADINIQDEDGSTALMCAAEHGHIEIVKHFLSQSDCDSSITDIDGSTALKIAMEAGHRHIGVLLYAHERNRQTTSTHSSKHKKSKSTSASPKAPSSPLPFRNTHRALPDTKINK